MKRLLAAIAVALIPVSVNAQTYVLSTQEQDAVSSLNQLLSDNNNRLVRMISDRGKADDLQNVCLRLDTGATIEELDNRVVEATTQVPDPIMREQTVEYFRSVVVVGIRVVCPRHNNLLDAIVGK